MQSIYLGTILLESNRWTTRIPSYQVSDWVNRFKTDGFDGIELWENHVLRCEQQELEAIRESGFPVGVYNSYVGFANEQLEERKKAAERISYLGAKAVKYNFGKEASRLEEYMHNVQEWASELPQDCRILCECHGGTVMEEPAVAAKAFSSFKDARFQAIVHAPNDPDKLERWFDALGEKITHVHVQLRDSDNKNIRLEKNIDQVRRCIQYLKQQRYAGTYTIEFTEGIRQPDVQIETLYEHALSDLTILRKVLAE